MPAAGGKGKPKNYAELSDDTKPLREEKQVTLFYYPLSTFSMLQADWCV